MRPSSQNFKDPQRNSYNNYNFKYNNLLQPSSYLNTKSTNKEIKIITGQSNLLNRPNQISSYVDNTNSSYSRPGFNNERNEPSNPPIGGRSILLLISSHKLVIKAIKWIHKRVVDLKEEAKK